MKEKIVILKCDNYDESFIYEKLSEGIKLLSLKKTPNKILIKPNMLSPRQPEEGVTTHPSILSAIIEIFKNKKIIIGDSPANISKPIEEYWIKCGYKKISEKYKVELKKFDISMPFDINVNNKTYKIPITSLINDYFILNVPKFKTHNLTTLTIGIKNLYGLIPGVTKTILHSKFVSPYDFSLFLVEFYKKIEDKIFLTVVDGITGMEGDGPSSGKLRNLGHIIIGEKPIYVDYVCCKLIGVQPEKIDFIKIYIEKYGIDKFEIIGDFEQIKDFKLPSTRKYFFIRNKFLSKLLLPIANFFKILPVIKEENCRKCYACYNICPVKAISNDLKFDRKKCILCLCCFEVCSYKAIRLKKSLIAKIFT
ncbi:MAG: DUF362 domain-containing protein [Candidatus Omnitrophica bacterium]|nr:DUF362 domain-containing protein [Candidatus Omnitrophota bacterium]MCM8802270.1 DUF362 domain-containing protein [Candidatus Omnitrophota bacterium]